MPKDFGSIVSDIRASLGITEPTLDTTVGTTVRKMIDAFAESLAEAHVDSALLSYTYDIDAKSGADLDDMVRLFGFYRRPAQRATGLVVFERMTTSETPILVDAGTRLEGANGFVFETVVPGVLAVGDTMIELPVQAVLGGAEGNLPPGSIGSGRTRVQGFDSVSNIVAFTGGTDMESDAHLRQRFKRTVFRSLAGTEQMYEGIALEDEDVSQVNVIGVTSRRFERIEVVAGAAVSTLEGARYIYPNSAFFGVDIQGGDHFVPGVHFEFDHTQNPPAITVLDSNVIPDGIYDLDFGYVSRASRNDIDGGITNRTDVYVNGIRSVDAVETLIFRHTAFNEVAGDPMDRTRFRRRDNSMPVAGNFLQRFGFTPVIDASVSNSIVINGVTYVEDTDYFLINDHSEDGLGTMSLSGIEWVSEPNGATKVVPDAGMVYTVTYIYNDVPAAVEAGIRRWRLTTSDPRVHQAKFIRLNFHLGVIYELGFSEGAVKPEVISAIHTYLEGVGFRGVVQVSDILAAAHGVSGVDAVRFLTSSDDLDDFAIQRVSEIGEVITTYATEVPGQIRRATDVLMADDEVPVLNEIFLTTMAQNTFGSV